jgi:uroporphyrinogen decarboxylase
MADQMSKRDRLARIFAGEEADRPGVALWRHWPGDDLSGDAFAAATITFQKTFDFDFVKVTPNSVYCIEGYGAKAQWIGNEEGTYSWGSRAITEPEDWVRLKPLDPRKGLMGEVLTANRLIGDEFGEDVPFIQTIFNPLSQAKNLAGARLLSDIRQHPDAIKTGLATITETTIRFIEELKTTGAAGIFLALQHATYDLLTEAEYGDVCRPLDLQILEATDGMWFNLIHLHGNNVMFDVAADYPAQLLNWHDTETPPSLSEAMDRTQMALCGGIRQWETMVRGTPEAIRAEAQAARAATGGARFVLGTGCVTPIIAPQRNIMAARRAVG